MISSRLEKLRFIVDEMQIAFHLALHLTDDPFVARTIARHILIRAENFIQHARELRKPLNIAGYATSSFHASKEAYASNFDEYFQVSRDRMGAHVQDLDFGKRIELWNDIEIGKISFFVDGAKELYQSLEPFNIPGYVNYTDPLELSDLALLESLRQFQRTLNNRIGVEMGVDPLAMTRNNTITALNATPVHARAGQIVLIRRWITMQCALRKELAAYNQISRILKARIITDFVSFCDCLVTRPVAAGAPQEMEGLDKLITANGYSSKPITDFIAVSNFQSILQTARDIRNRIGAHFEVDNTLASLLTDLDSYDIDQELKFYSRVDAVFTKTCSSIIFLRMYAADGQRLYGVSASHASAVPYTDGEPIGLLAPPDPPPIDDEQAYSKNLMRWLDGNAVQRGEARQFFWHVFAGSQILEIIDGNEFRKGHQFFVSILSDDLSNVDFRGILDLILSCRSGWPYPLAEILVRHGQSASVFRQCLICHALGEIGSSPHVAVHEFLEQHAHSQSFPIKIQATLALFKIFVKSEGLFRLNNRDQTLTDYDALVDTLMASMSESEHLVCLFAFASILSGSKLGFLSRPFQCNYTALQAEIETHCLSFLKDDDKKSKAGVLKQLIQTNDYVGVCVLMAANNEANEQQHLYRKLIDYCCDGLIAPAGHDQALRHLAICFLLKKEYRVAFEIAEEIASRNPDWVGIQLLSAQILTETPGAEEEATKKIAALHDTYNLTDEDKASLAAYEAEVLKKRI